MTVTKTSRNVGPKLLMVLGAIVMVGGCGVASIWTLFAPMADNYTPEIHKQGMAIFWTVSLIGLALAVGGWISRRS